MKRSYSKPTIVKASAKLQSVAAQYVSYPIMMESPQASG